VTVLGNDATPSSTTSTGEAAPAELGRVDDERKLSAVEVAGQRQEQAAGELVLVNVPFNGQKQITVALRPSRTAAAWLMWVLVSLLVIAFWLPLPRRRGMRGALVTSSVPAKRRRR
jgi:hypothetical protein